MVFLDILLGYIRNLKFLRAGGESSFSYTDSLNLKDLKNSGYHSSLHRSDPFVEPTIETQPAS